MEAGIERDMIEQEKTEKQFVEEEMWRALENYCPHAKDSGDKRWPYWCGRDSVYVTQQQHEYCLEAMRYERGEQS